MPLSCRRSSELVNLEGAARSLDPGRGSRVARRRAVPAPAWRSARRSDRRGRRGGSRQDPSSSARRGRLAPLAARTAQASTRRRRATVNMHNKLVGMADAAAAHAAARAAASDDRRAHFGAPLLVLLHRGGMACWICETRAPPGAAHVKRCSGHMDWCTRRALAGARFESF